MIMKRNITLLLLALLTLCSCEDFLDIKPYGKTIPRTAEEFSALVHQMANGIDTGGTAESAIVGSVSNSEDMEMMADNLEAYLTELPGGNMLPFYIGDRLSAKQSVYSNLYQTIRNCNIILDEFEEGRNTRDGQDIVGTAYALRGICYYQLLRQFCPPPAGGDEMLGVPLVTEFDMEAAPLRSTFNETVLRAEADLKAAINCHIANEMYRINDDVCTGYLARLYFWAGRYGDALEKAQALMEKYPLLSGEDYTAMMTTQFGMNGNMLIKGDRIQSSYSSIPAVSEQARLRPISARFVNLFPEKASDIRYRLFVDKKRKNKKTIFACMRAAEMHLIAMESRYHTDDEEGALQALNDFRRCRIEDVTDYTMETLPAIREDEYITTDAKGQPLNPLIYAILTERRKELFMEGDRFFELKRNGRPEFWVTKKGLKYYTRRFMYTFPLPVADITVQPLLKQNPGYVETL